MVDVVVRGHHRHAGPFEPHLEIAARRRGDRANAVNHLAGRGHDDGGAARLQFGHRLLADLAADHQPVSPVLLDLRALLIGEREQGELLPVLFEHDIQGFETRPWRLHGDLQRGRDSDELFRLVDLNRRAGHSSRDDVGAPGRKHHDQHQTEQKTHPLMIPAGTGKESGASVDDRAGGWLKSVVRRGVPVSSRGQDTWFSATGPGFESPYRYQPSLTTHAKVAHRSSQGIHPSEGGLSLRSQRATDGRPSFA